MCRSRRELSNAYLLAKFGFDTVENEPCKVCPLSAYRSPRSNKEIERIAQDESLDAEAKQAAIDRINQKTTEQLAELSRAQAATQHGLDGIEAGSIDFDMSAEGQMQALAIQLKDGQLAVVQQALKEKEMMADQVKPL